MVLGRKRRVQLSGGGREGGGGKKKKKSREAEAEVAADQQADQQENMDAFADPEVVEAAWESGELFDPEQDDHDVLPGRWKLYGVGLKFRTRPVKSLFMRSFIEVPGVAENQRTNHVPRQVGYRGFMRDKKSGWHHVDAMTGGTGKAGVSNKKWDRAEEGPDVDYDFVCSCGGLEQIPSSKIARKAAPLTEQPLYMRRIGQTEIDIPYPAIVAHQIATPSGTGENGEGDGEKGVNTVTLLRVNVPATSPSFHKAGAPVRIEIYSGRTDGQCLREEWDTSSTIVGTAAGGISDIRVRGIPIVHSIRVLVIYTDLQVWSLVPYVPAVAAGR